METQRHGVVTVVSLGEGENRLAPALLEALFAVLEEVASQDGPAALVTHGAGDFYSNGYDLDWLRGRSVEEQRAFVADHERLLAQLLLLPVPSVAAISGHAIGGGALIALAHDFRVMREDRCTFWLPEIDARIPFRPGMLALLRQRLLPDVLRDVVLGGERLAGARAKQLRVVDETVAADALLDRAVERAEALARKDRRTFGRMKQRLYGDVAAALAPGIAEVR